MNFIPYRKPILTLHVPLYTTAYYVFRRNIPKSGPSPITWSHAVVLVPEYRLGSDDFQGSVNYSPFKATFSEIHRIDNAVT